MKKILAVLIALVLVLSLSSFAMAEELKNFSATELVTDKEIPQSPFSTRTACPL